MSVCLYSSSSVVSKQWWRLLSDEGNVLLKRQTVVKVYKQVDVDVCCCLFSGSAEKLRVSVRSHQNLDSIIRVRWGPVLSVHNCTDNFTEQPIKREWIKLCVDWGGATRTRTSVRHHLCQHQPESVCRVLNMSVSCGCFTIKDSRCLT